MSNLDLIGMLGLNPLFNSQHACMIRIYTSMNTADSRFLITTNVVSLRMLTFSSRGLGLGLQRTSMSEQAANFLPVKDHRHIDP